MAKSMFLMDYSKIFECWLHIDSSIITNIGENPDVY